MGKEYTIDKMPIEIYLDKQKDIKITIAENENGEMKYTISAPNIKNKNLLKNIERLVGDGGRYNGDAVEGILDDIGIGDVVGVSFDGVFESIRYDLEKGEISVPEIPTAVKTLMIQKENVKLPKMTDVVGDREIKTDLHAHYTAMLEPERLLALGLKHNVDYNCFYVYALDLETNATMQDKIDKAIIQQLRVNDKEKVLTEDTIEQLLVEIENNKGNYRKIEEIFTKHKLQKVAIPLKDIVLEEPLEVQSALFNIKKILESCSLPREAQSTFTDMIDTYNNRFPFTNGKGKGFEFETYGKVIASKGVPEEIKIAFKETCADRNNAAFEGNDLQMDTILWIARNAQKEGISHVEMSHNTLASEKNKEALETYDNIIAQVEEETKTKLSFLAGISRTTSAKKFGQMENRLRESLSSKYVVGIDILGEEVNPTEDVFELLKDMTEYALNEDPDMVIRVHAGETNTFPGNCSKAIEIVYRQYLEKVKTSPNPSKVKKPNFRIGHGIYGLSEEMKIIDKESEMGKIAEGLAEVGILEKEDVVGMTLLDFMAKMDIVVERCMSSNILLSHQNSLVKDPIKTYIDAGVKCVIATDGYGVYGTTSQEEVKVAFMKGLDARYIDRIRDAERYIEERSNARENFLSNKPRIITGNVGEKNESNITNASKKRITTFPKDKKAIVIAGGSYNGFYTNNAYISSEVTETDQQILEGLIKNANPEKDVFVLGSRIEGPEKRLIDLIVEENKMRKSEGRKEFGIIVVASEFEKLSDEQKRIIKDADITVIESHEKSEMANYKKINSEIFSQGVEADLIILDGAQAAVNLMADANKGKNNRIFFKPGVNNFLKEKIEVLDNVHPLVESSEPKTVDVVKLGKETLEEQKDVEGKDGLNNTLTTRGRQIEEATKENKGVEL